MIDFSNTLLRLVAVLVLFHPVFAVASPGAHGPNGEHLDGPVQTASGTNAVPRMEAKSEAFELVGQLRNDEFSMLVNRFETNEPVLDAKVEVETGALKAPAKFHADMGDYAVDDAAFLKALKAAGSHAVVVTIVAGAEADLLEGKLKSPDEAAGSSSHVNDGAQDRGVSLVAWLALVLAVIGGLIYALRRRKATTAAAWVGGAQ